MIASDATYVSEAHESKNNDCSKLLRAGKTAVPGCPASWSDNDTLVKFGPISALPSGAILSARMYLFADAVLWGIPGYGISIGVFKNLNDFDGRSANWTNKPETGRDPDALICFGRSHVPGYVFCDITRLAGEWAGSQENFGVTLKTAPKDRRLALFASLRSQNPPFADLQFIPAPGRCCPGYLQARFDEFVFDIEGCGSECFSPAVDMADAEQATFFIQNTSQDALTVGLQISADGTDYINDAQTTLLPAGETAVMTPYYFAKYCRVRLSGPKEDGTARIRCQIQTRNYYMY